MTRDWRAILKVAIPAGIILAMVAVVFWRRHGQYRQWEKALNDPRPAVRAHAIRHMPPEANKELLIAALNDDNVDVRLLAVERIGPGPKTIGALIEALADDRASVRREASWSLSFIRREELGQLKEALKDDNPLIRAGAALALEDALRHKNSWLRREDLRSNP